MVFANAKWIWEREKAERDEYAEFLGEFIAKERAKVRLSVDGDYALFINGIFVASNQYGDFEYYKVYDEIDISEFVRNGKNELQLLCWHFGRDNMHYKTYQAGVIFEVEEEGEILLSSDEKTLCKKSDAYESGYNKLITTQLGDSFYYDGRKNLFEGKWHNGVLVDKLRAFFSRPNEKLRLGEKIEAKLIKSGENRYLYDLGKELVGLPFIKFNSPKEQLVTVAYGEHIADGEVRRKVGDRDFSFEYYAKEGENDFTEYMLRLGVRYLEVFTEVPCEISIGVIEQYYPVEEREVEIESELDRRIYEICVRSLRLSMMEHYVDCPWREQGLYNLDSRNQMLFGYYAFKNGNTDYVRSNLELMAQDRREDNMLTICFPSGNDFTIPSFTLHFFLQVGEYIRFTSDKDFANKVYPKLCSVIKPFVENIKDGLVCKFKGACYWNFYDWTDHMDGFEGGGNYDDYVNAFGPDLMINLLTIMALENLQYVCEFLGQNFEYFDILAMLRRRTKECFFVKESGLYKMNKDDEVYPAFANALAVILELSVGDEAKKICSRLASGEGMIECALATKVFKFDALLKTDENYKDKVLAELREDFTKMLDAGATSTWETLDGEKAFNDAGSLCHGWTALPVYYFHRFGIAKYK